MNQIEEITTEKQIQHLITKISAYKQQIELYEVTR